MKAKIKSRRDRRNITKNKTNEGENKKKKKEQRKKETEEKRSSFESKKVKKDQILQSLTFEKKLATKDSVN